MYALCIGKKLDQIEYTEHTVSPIYSPVWCAQIVFFYSLILAPACILYYNIQKASHTKMPLTCCIAHKTTTTTTPTATATTNDDWLAKQMPCVYKISVDQRFLAKMNVSLSACIRFGTYSHIHAYKQHFNWLTDRFEPMIISNI